LNRTEEEDLTVIERRIDIRNEFDAALVLCYYRDVCGSHAR